MEYRHAVLAAWGVSLLSTLSLWVLVAVNEPPARICTPAACGASVVLRGPRLAHVAPLLPALSGNE